MPINRDRARECLKSFDFRKLFVEELGWDRHTERLPDIIVDGQTFILNAVAHKRGMVAYVCDPAADGSIPPYALRRKIEHRLARQVHEHIIIHVDQGKTTQTWQWVKREQGKPAACREHTFHKGHSGQALIQRLEALVFTIEEEEAVTIIDVSGRVRAAFDVEKVTKKFYDCFKKERDKFASFLKGIPDKDMQSWYVSVMINRLMFIYFIQKKGFLHNDQGYLETKLLESRMRGKDRYYRDFLCPLFFEGFARRPEDRSEHARMLLGEIPYLNGGIFQKHEIEQHCGQTIEIADKAFEHIFDFFGAYHWHLDERPLRDDREINPDVLGYIFEKYINQKQMGAYYTKEDITGYISQNTIIPRIFDMAREKCKIAFDGEHSIWRLLQDDPDRYIYDAVKKGMELPLPAEIAAGVADVSQRTGWNEPAPADYALPTEIWREVVARRQRCEEIRRFLQRSTGVPPVTPQRESGTESGTGVPPVTPHREGGTESGTGVPPVASGAANRNQPTGETPVLHSPVSPDFHTFSSLLPVDVTRRNLPHWQQSGAIYFITFRLADSLPAAKLNLWRQEKDAWLKAHPQPWSAQQQAEYARLFPDRLNEWLDAGEGACILSQPAISQIVEKALRHFDGQRYVLDQFVIMPNHVHVLVAPLPDHRKVAQASRLCIPIAEILHSWKSFTAHEINKQLNRTGTVWQDESFDHLVRSPEQLEFHRAYIRDNPAKAGLESSTGVPPVSSECSTGVPPVAAAKYRLGMGIGVHLNEQQATGETPVLLSSSRATGETPVPRSFSINDLITLNLNIRQFAQDVIETCEGVDLLRALWKAVRSVTVLDPTCGSGAFLFAALNILESLYEACLDRMQLFLEDLDRSGQKHRADKFGDFRTVLDDIARHPNRPYFIYKSIILNNLFGVDIMDEAVEICKLRLFLKLVAQVDAADKIEPLPDIDFNIRAGNTLVGYVNLQQVREALKGDLLGMQALPVIEEKAEH
ncbi:MAG TPA: DNA methyltransferase, partial [Planctomycetota bacterium]|nr:DNA methyltransferase [Planctomycetota bacterium]